jgi:hypothetical protein
MSFQDGVLFDAVFIGKLQHWIGLHHEVYPKIPPQGIFFESLVWRAFIHAGWPKDKVILENPNSPRADIKVGETRLSLKTETGKATRKGLISITKLCTTEKGEWVSKALILHAISHLSRYEGILMLRAIHSHESRFDYQLLEIPLALLRKMETCEALPIGRRKERKSLAFDVTENGVTLFHVHFDGTDGKCQVQRLRVDQCIMLSEWEQSVPKE